MLAAFEAVHHYLSNYVPAPWAIPPGRTAHDAGLLDALHPGGVRERWWNIAGASALTTPRLTCAPYSSPARWCIVTVSAPMKG